MVFLLVIFKEALFLGGGTVNFRVLSDGKKLTLLTFGELLFSGGP